MSLIGGAGKFSGLSWVPSGSVCRDKDVLRRNTCALPSAVGLLTQWTSRNWTFLRNFIMAEKKRTKAWSQPEGSLSPSEKFHTVLICQATFQDRLEPR